MGALFLRGPRTRGHRADTRRSCGFAERRKLVALDVEHVEEVSAVFLALG